jgi:hypothetical protein
MIVIYLLAKVALRIKALIEVKKILKQILNRKNKE